MNQKRPFDEVDTDYQEFDFLAGHRSKRQKLLEHDAKEATIKKIETIIRREFARELCNKEAEIDLIDERINEGRRVLDRLRACIVAQHYSKVLPTAAPSSSASVLSESQSTVIHPAVKKFIGKTICSSRSTHCRPSLAAFAASRDVDSLLIDDRSRLKQASQLKASANSQVNRSQSEGVVPIEQCRGDRFKIVKKLIVGNVSKYLAPDKKEANDKSTHKWMVYVRGPKEEPPIDEFVEKVCFFLHDSYFPNNVVEITQPPFHLTRRGWGEFQVRVQLHCRGPSRKIFNISHQLKLDRTYTGLQTMGAETVVEIKLDKEITDSLSGRLSRVLQDPSDSPPRHEAETIEQFPQVPIKEEKNDDGYEDRTSTELTGKFRGKFREAFQEEFSPGSPSVCAPSLTSTVRTERKNISQSVDSEASFGALRHFDVFARISEGDSLMPVASKAATGLDQVSESSLQPETIGRDGDRRSDSRSFLLENKTRELTGFPMNPVCSQESTSASVECSSECREAEDCDNVQAESVVGDAVSLERASFDGVCMEPESCEEVSSDNVCLEPDGLSAKSQSCYDMHNGDVDMEHDGLCVELEGCDDVCEEVVLTDTICVKPIPGDDVREEFSHSGRTRDTDGATDETCLKSFSCAGEPGTLADDMETEPSGDCKSGTPLTHDASSLDREPDISVGGCPEQAVKVEPSACAIEARSASQAVEVPARKKETEEEGFLRCIDSSGRVFRIPRHLIQSSSVAKTNATVQVSQGVAQLSKTSGANRLNSAVDVGEPGQPVTFSQGIATSLGALPLTGSATHISTANNRFATGENTSVNRVVVNSKGLQNLMNVAMKEVCVVDRGGKPGSVLGATTIVGPGASRVRGAIRGESGDFVVVAPCTGSRSFSTRNSVILPVQRNGGEPRTMTLVTPGGVRGVTPFGVRVLHQSQLMKQGSALPSVRTTVVESDPPKTVVLRSVGLGSNQSPVVLGNMRPASLVRTSDGGTVTFMATKRPRGVAPISSVRVLPPGVSAFDTTSPVLPSPATSGTRLLHSQLRPVGRALPSQLRPIGGSLPSQVIPIVRSSLPAQVHAIVRTLSSQVSPVVRCLSSQVSPVVRCLSSQVSPVVRCLSSQVSPVVRPLSSQVSPVVRCLSSQVSPAVRCLSSQVSPVVRPLSSQVSPVVRSLSSQVSPVQHSVQQSCTTSKSKVDSPPVFLLVPSEVKGHPVVVSPNSPRPPVRHVLFVPKGTKVSSSGLTLTSHLKTKNVASMQPVKPLSGIPANQDIALTSMSTSIRLATDNSGKPKAVSILRPPGPPSSTMTSLLKKNLFVQPAAVPVSLAQGEGQHPGTIPLSNNMLPCAKSSTAKSLVQAHPSSLACTAENLLTTQIGNQTVIVKLDSTEKCGLAAQSKKNEVLRPNDVLPSTPSVATQENRLPVVRPKEKHLMFKTLRESSLKRPPEDVTANINLQDLESMEDLVRSLVKHFPVYGANVGKAFSLMFACSDLVRVSYFWGRYTNMLRTRRGIFHERCFKDRSVHPYRATSWNGFLQWNIGKRRAAELCRAVAVQRKMLSLVNDCVTFRGETIWSKQRIIRWCRHHLYTPLDHETMAVRMKENQVEKPSDPPEAFSSLTNHKDALNCLDALSRMSSTVQDKGNDDDGEDTELDVVAIAVEESPVKETKRLPVKVVTGAEVIPPGVEAQFVYETAAKIGIRLSPVPVLPDECPDVLSSTVEEMIAAATRAFANELVRTAAARLFDSGRNPLQLDVASICEAIRLMSRCDFLTNHSLGVQEEEMSHS